MNHMTNNLNNAEEPLQEHLKRTIQNLEQRCDLAMRELSLVRRVSDCLGQHANADDACLSVLNIVMEEIAVHNCSIMLLDDQRNALSLRAVKGAMEPVAHFFEGGEPVTFKLGEGIAGLVVQDSVSIRVDDVSKDERFVEHNGDNVGSLLCLPLRSREQTIGVFVLSHPATGFFSDEDERVLHIIANQAGLVLDHMQTLDQLRVAEQSMSLTVHNLEDDVRRRTRELVHAERLAAIGTFVSGVAHELNNPLSIVVGYADILRRSGTITPKDMEKIIAMQQAGIRASHIVVELLSYTGKRRLQRKALSLNQVITQALALRENRFARQNVQIESTLTPDLIDTVGDDSQLQQAFLYLLDNAIDAMAVQAGGGTLVITSRQDGQFVEAVITDNGPGIPEHMRDQIFDPFMTTKDPGDGMGLGISLSYWIVNRHNGKLVLDTDYSDGARFILTLPVLPTIDAGDDMPNTATSLS
jgi:signal transduction histidine kinase